MTFSQQLELNYINLAAFINRGNGERFILNVSSTSITTAYSYISELSDLPPPLAVFDLSTYIALIYRHLRVKIYQIIVTFTIHSFP